MAIMPPIWMSPSAALSDSERSMLVSGGACE